MKEYFNCFIGIPIHPGSEYKIQELQKAMQKYIPNGSLVEPSYAHITLYYLGYQTKRKLEEVAEIIYEERELIRDLKLRVGNMGIFYSENKVEDTPYVIYLEVRNTNILSDFKEHLNSHLDLYNREERTNYIPHITLARLKTNESKVQFSVNSEKINEMLSGVNWNFEPKEIYIYGKPSINNPKPPEVLFKIPLF